MTCKAGHTSCSTSVNSTEKCFQLPSNTNEGTTARKVTLILNFFFFFLKKGCSPLYSALWLPLYPQLLLLPTGVASSAALQWWTPQQTGPDQPTRETQGQNQLCAPVHCLTVVKHSSYWICGSCRFGHTQECSYLCGDTSHASDIYRSTD